MNQSHQPSPGDTSRVEQQPSKASTNAPDPEIGPPSADIRAAHAAAGEETIRHDLLRKPLWAHAEPLIVISTAHLHPDTRKRLADGTLSVLAHANDHGGFVYVGTSSENEPTEPELATLFKAARTAGIVWLKVDGDGPVVDGLPTFDDPPWD